MECQKEQNKEQYCNCTYSFGKKGACCDCLHYHRKMGQLPACYFPDELEKTYDRSIDRFIKVYQQRGRWW